MDGKKELRKRMLSLRSGLDGAQRAAWDAAMADQALRMREYQEAEAVLTYVSYQSEADTRRLIGQALADGKAVFVPRVSGREMEFWRIEAMTDLREGYRGIPEPEPVLSFPAWLAAQKERPESGGRHGDADGRAGLRQAACRAVMWMPGVAFDREKNRIGYGGGFYDRYLARLSIEREDGGQAAGACQAGQRLILLTAALAYGCQVLETIPNGAHDIRPDRIVTEVGVIR